MPTLVMKFNKDDHQIDVDTYVSVLGALSIIAKEVNYRKNSNSDIQLNIVAHKEGSFDSVIEFVCVTAPLLIQYTPMVIDIINTIIELYKIKRLSDQIDPTKTQSIEDNKVQLFNNNGEGILVVNNVTNNIYNNNQSVHDAMASSFSKINEDETITGFRMSSKDEDVNFDRSEFSAMAKKVTIEPQEAEDQVKAATLVIVKPILEKSHNKWTFYLSGNSINADIKDETFLNEVEKGERSFRSGDRLMVELQIRSEYNDVYKVFIPKSYTILKVKNHLTADEAVQMNMF